MPDTLTTNEETIKQEALTVIERAKIVRITDQETYDGACSILLNEIKPFRKRWAEYWDEIKKPAYAAYKAIQAKFSEGDEPLERAERQVKMEIAKWDAEQERIRQELQRKAEEEARKAEEEERLRVATLAEESGASPEQVNAIVDAPVTAVATPVASTYAKAAGVSTRENWKAKVTDLKKLCAAVGKGQVPLSYVIPNEAALNARAKADKATLNIPGVVAYNDPIVSGRSR
jgi:hypothetical protein